MNIPYCIPRSAWGLIIYVVVVLCEGGALQAAQVGITPR